MSGMRSLGFHRNAWSAPLKIWRCSAMEPTTVSRDEPLYAAPNVPASICETTAEMPRRIDRKFLSRSSQRNHVWYVPPASARQRSMSSRVWSVRMANGTAGQLVSVSSVTRPLRLIPSAGHNQRSLPGSSRGNGVHRRDLHSRELNPHLRERAEHRLPRSRGVEPAPRLRDKDVQSMFSLTDLPTLGRHTVERVFEHDGMNGHELPADAWEAQHVVRPALDRVDEAERTPAGAAPSRDADPVRHLVPDERERAREEDRHEELVPRDAVRNGAILRVDDLRDDEVLEQVHAGVRGALGRDAPGLRRRVHLERRAAPRARRERPRFGGEHLGRTIHGAGADAEALAQLLLREDADHGRIGYEHVRAERVQRFDESVEGLSRVKPVRR